MTTSSGSGNSIPMTPRLLLLSRSAGVGLLAGLSFLAASYLRSVAQARGDDSCSACAVETSLYDYWAGISMAVALGALLLCALCLLLLGRARRDTSALAPEASPPCNEDDRHEAFRRPTQATSDPAK